ncbi:hypothetical protein [Prevotella lacticifex]|uniref:hypothetical protein n=1 Tax=Prevotella lacticifex TaxID=2854755 RepID=UPI001CC6026B|nr:hypothetical protein [Prevotella lacticifex]
MDAGRDPSIGRTKKNRFGSQSGCPTEQKVSNRGFRASRRATDIHSGHRRQTEFFPVRQQHQVRRERFTARSIQEMRQRNLFHVLVHNGKKNEKDFNDGCSRHDDCNERRGAED